VTKCSTLSTLSELKFKETATCVSLYLKKHSLKGEMYGNLRIWHRGGSRMWQTLANTLTDAKILTQVRSIGDWLLRQKMSAEYIFKSKGIEAEYVFRTCRVKKVLLRDGVALTPMPNSILYCRSLFKVQRVGEGP
uniref:G-protein coupled receptors family 1 profile domain-containing protein n=1 Tax=Parascaris univalens TaxID=6257 RepID=A0A915C0K3_PARUN